MEELYELRRYIETGDTAAALALLDEMDEMSKDDKIRWCPSIAWMNLNKREARTSAIHS
jgi:hypothetical protein